MYLYMLALESRANVIAMSVIDFIFLESQLIAPELI